MDSDLGRPPKEADPWDAVTDPYLLKNELLKAETAVKHFEVTFDNLDDWLRLRQHCRTLEAQLTSIKLRELDKKIAANEAAVRAVLPPGPEEFDLDGMPLTPWAAEFRSYRTRPGWPIRAEERDDGGLRPADLAAASRAFQDELANILVDQATDATVRERSLHLDVLVLEQLHRTPWGNRAVTLGQLKAQEQEAHDEAAGYVERLRVIDPEVAEHFAEVRWGIFHPAELEEQRLKERLEQAETESARIAEIISLINASGSYDDGQQFGWKGAGAKAAPPERDEAIEHVMESLDEMPAAPAPASEAETSAVPAAPKSFSRTVMISAGVLLLAISGAALAIVFSPTTSSSPSGNTATGASTGATSGAAAASAAAVACASLAAEDLTFTGLPGASGPTHVTSDCGVVVSATSPRCRVVIGTADSRGVRNPSLFDERIGFDVGANHYDVFFQASWYEPDPYVITVPGRGLFAGPAGAPRGGTAEIKMYGGPKGASTTLGWTAESGTITFSTEADLQHPAGGGTVDMQMKGGAATAPIHISGTWHAEQPCATS